MSTNKRLPWHDPPRYPQLTHEPPIEATGLQIGATVVAAILIFLLLNVGANAFLSRYTSNRGYWIIQQKWRLLAQVDEAPDWLILGDSSANQGVAPEGLATELGGTALNLATVANLSLANDAWMLATLIERTGPPDSVLIVHTYDVWPRNVRPVMISQTGLRWNAWETLAPPVSLAQSDQMTVFLSRHLPLIGQNNTLSNIIFDRVFRGRPLFQSNLSLTASGQMPVLAPNPDNVTRDANNHREFLRDNTFTVAPINREALAEIRRLADEHEIDVYLAHAPLFAGLYAEPAMQTFISDRDEWLAAFTATSPFLHLVPGVQTFSSAEMENADHVISAAAVVYTRELAAAIARQR